MRFWLLVVIGHPLFKVGPAHESTVHIADVTRREIAVTLGKADTGVFDRRSVPDVDDTGVVNVANNQLLAPIVGAKKDGTIVVY
jgi:hypothetical protein